MNNSFSSLIVLLLACQYSSASSSNFTSQARSAAFTLQELYDPSTGLWETVGWWHSANCLTVMADLASVDEYMRELSSFIWPRTLARAQAYNREVLMRGKEELVGWGSPKHNDEDNNDENDNGENVSASLHSQGFLNDYYDDEGWWALAWIKVYDLTGERQYLDVATDLFEDMKCGWGTPCGGIWWDKKHTYVNAIANELFLSVAAHLANRKANKKYYLAWAIKAWDFIRGSGMINSEGTVNDGLDMSTCKNNGHEVWSYNQGTILGGLIELAHAQQSSKNKKTKNRSHLDSALAIAKAAISSLSDEDNILHDPCEPSCGEDGGQFKGIFMRNLALLQLVAPDEEVGRFIRGNAVGVLESAGVVVQGDEDENVGVLGLVWGAVGSDAGEVVVVDASTQSSGLDALVAAVMIA